MVYGVGGDKYGLKLEFGSVAHSFVARNMRSLHAFILVAAAALQVSALNILLTNDDSWASANVRCVPSQ